MTIEAIRAKLREIEESQSRGGALTRRMDVPVFSAEEMREVLEALDRIVRERDKRMAKLARVEALPSAWNKERARIVARAASGYTKDAALTVLTDCYNGLVVALLGND